LRKPMAEISRQQDCNTEVHETTGTRPVTLEWWKKSDLSMAVAVMLGAKTSPVAVILEGAMEKNRATWEQKSVRLFNEKEKEDIPPALILNNAVSCTCCQTVVRGRRNQLKKRFRKQGNHKLSSFELENPRSIEPFKFFIELSSERFSI